MEEFKILREPQPAADFQKNQPSGSVLDLIFCYECDETFDSKEDERRHRCGVSHNNSSDSFEFPNISTMAEDESEETNNLSTSTVTADEDGKYHFFKCYFLIIFVHNFIHFR